MTGDTSERRFLVVVAGAQTCALDLSDVVEIMRPLPIEPMPHPRPFVRGVSVVRGAPVPVVDLVALLSPGTTSPSFGRFVSIHPDAAVARAGRATEERRFVLGVDEVHGVVSIDAARMAELDPLLRSEGGEAVEALVRGDERLQRVLSAARAVPADLFSDFAEAREAAGR